ncbi:hypothetical protein ACHAXS_010763 [Conticribra weissflogii]
MTSNTLKSLPLEQILTSLSAKQPTPGGGASAALTAAIGAATAQMSAAYTSRKKDKDSGAHDKAQALLSRSLPVHSFLQSADDDVAAYADLQRTWRETAATMGEDEKRTIEQRALRVPTELLEDCHRSIVDIVDFLPFCNENITSDAKVGIHQLAGAARAAFQTVLVNRPGREERRRLEKLLREIGRLEDEILGLDQDEKEEKNQEQ